METLLFIPSVRGPRTFRHLFMQQQETAQVTPRTHKGSRLRRNPRRNRDLPPFFLTTSTVLVGEESETSTIFLGREIAVTLTAQHSTQMPWPSAVSKLLHSDVPSAAKLEYASVRAGHLLFFSYFICEEAFLHFRPLYSSNNRKQIDFHTETT